MSDTQAETDSSDDTSRVLRFRATFDITYDDYLALCDAQELWKTSKWKLPRWAHWSLTGVIAAGGLGLIAAGDAWFGGALLVGVAFLLLLEFALIPLARKRSYTQQGLHGMTVTLKADDDGFNMANPKADSRISWDAVKRIDRFRQHLILWTSRKTGLVLPERAFDDKAQADAFHAFVTSRISDDGTQ